MEILARSANLERMVLLFLLAAASPAGLAQQPQALQSPEVHPDRRVTFRFRAPNAKEVLLAREGAAVLERDRSIVLTFKAEAAAREALAAALAAGAAVVSFTPHRRSLEELFVERARGKAATS